MNIPTELANALGPIPRELDVLGFTTVEVQKSESFGNFRVLFRRGAIDVSIVRDRGQFLIGDDVDSNALKAAGLWKTFSGPNQIVEPLVSWLKTRLEATA